MVQLAERTPDPELVAGPVMEEDEGLSFEEAALVVLRELSGNAELRTRVAATLRRERPQDAPLLLGVLQVLGQPPATARAARPGPAAVPDPAPVAAEAPAPAADPAEAPEDIAAKLRVAEAEWTPEPAAEAKPRSPALAKTRPDPEAEARREPRAVIGDETPAQRILEDGRKRRRRAARLGRGLLGRLLRPFGNRWAVLGGVSGVLTVILAGLFLLG